MDLAAVEELREDLDAFCAEVFASIPRKDSRAWGSCYLRGLMLDGRRKSIQPMAERLPDGNMQALQQFVGQSPWEHTPVQRRLATKVSEAITPDAWVIDDSGLPKAGTESVGAAHQWCGALGKQAVCQSAVSLHAVTDAASVPLNWRLYLPQDWADAADERRVKTGVPDRVGHREKWRLALDMVDEARSWGLADRVVVADAGYGQIHGLRHGLAERGLDYVVAVRGDLNAHPGGAVPRAPDRSGPGPRLPRYRTPARSLKDLALEQGRAALRRCTWRQGSRGAMRGRFLVMDVRLAGKSARQAALDRAGGRSTWDGVLPVETLIAEWPPHGEAPTDYWLSSLSAGTVLRQLVRLAKIRWRIEHDYRELKHGLGLDHYEGRTWRGWHHHVTLVSAAQAFLTLRRLDPKGSTSV
ncbi:IS701 family transposase [Nocardiopsis sp. CA-288880]|uniref:IS701 family transposase n=1 Tax=Nocardiopsis sp. CA-288880 TaxID=3239995 RepID=UPI003D95D989